jgi:tocopherol O-methyltransferase
MIAPRHPISSRDVARHYDELDAFYRELWGEHVHHGYWRTGRESPEEATVQLVERVAAAAGIGPDSAVCDVGCGYGATARWLARVHQARVTGVTVSPHQHRFAEAQATASGPAPTYLLGDWLDTSLPEAAFDAVLFIESLAHMQDKQRALTAAQQVLRPSGRLVACVWLAASGAPAWAERHILEPICREGQLPGLPTTGEYRRVLSAAGFHSIQTEDISRNVQRTWSVVVGRVVRAILTRPVYRRYLLDRAQQNRSFALSVLRLWVGFRIGAVQYGFISARKPD